MVLVKLSAPFFAIRFTKEILFYTERSRSALSLSVFAEPNRSDRTDCLVGYAERERAESHFSEKKIRPPPVKIPYISPVKQNQR